MSQDYASENIGDYSLHTIPGAYDNNALHHIQTDDPAGSSGTLMEVSDTLKDVTDEFFTDLSYNIIKGAVTMILQCIVNVKPCLCSHRNGNKYYFFLVDRLGICNID